MVTALTCYTDILAGETPTHTIKINKSLLKIKIIEKVESGRLHAWSSLCPLPLDGSSLSHPWCKSCMECCQPGALTEALIPRVGTGELGHTHLPAHLHVFSLFFTLSEARLINIPTFPAASHSISLDLWFSTLLIRNPLIQLPMLWWPPSIH